MTELTFLKELKLVIQVHQNSAIFVTIGSFQKEGLSFDKVFAIDAMMC